MRLFLSRIILFFFCLLFLFNESSCSVLRSESSLSHIIEQHRNHSITIRNDIDLKGQTLSFPEGCKLVFKRGRISNGNIVFNKTIINGHPKFSNCTYSGQVQIKKIDDRDFKSSDDTKTLAFLLYNGIINGAKCFFYRDYRINMKDASGYGLVNIKDVDSGADFCFQGHTIFNTASFPEAQIKQVFVLQNVKNITFRNLLFKDAEEHNSHNFRKSSGCTLIQCLGDCESINLIDCSQVNGDCILRSGVYTHSVNYSKCTPYIGLSKSILHIKSYNTGYGLALYGGDSLDIEIDARTPRRGFYCAGVSNSKVLYKGYNPKETSCHILLKDAVCKKKNERGNDLIDMKGCKNLTVKLVVEEVFQEESLIDFSSYGSGKMENTDFSFRSEMCHHANIDISGTIYKTPKAGYFFISRFLSYGGDSVEGEEYGCKVSEVIIHNFCCVSGESRPYMCKIDDGIVADITVDSCYVTSYNEENGFGYDFVIKGNSTGRLHISNTLIGNVLVREKNRREFNVEVEGESFTRKLGYIEDKSDKRLVRVVNVR